MSVTFEELRKRYLEATTSEKRVDVLDEAVATGDSDIVVKFYDMWNENYDQDVAHYKYVNPAAVAKQAEVYLKDAKDKHIIDVASGTGELGHDLKKRGFKNIDAHDGSTGMLAIAKQRGDYANYYQEFLKIDGTIKFKPPASYDGVVSSGSFYPHHLHGGHLHQVLMMAKPGCYAVISGSPDNDEPIHMKPAIKKMVDDGVIEVVYEEYIDNWWDTHDGRLWVFKRLK